MRKPAGPQLPERIFRTKSYVLIGLVLLVPIVPFALFGWWLEPLAEKWTQASKSDNTQAALVIGLLASDILLPIPSSVISTLAGNQLGIWRGTGCSWLGMSLSAILGFGLAKPLGRRWEQQRLDDGPAATSSLHWNTASLALFRGLPILAEASILHAGLRGMRWRQFLPPVLLSNLGISAAYAWLGETATSLPALVVLLGIVACAPLLISLAVRRRRRQPVTEKDGTMTDTGNYR
jgi:uncharacterized membrane protein YdjX (TVP38/TMEM64 family)